MRLTYLRLVGFQKCCDQQSQQQHKHIEHIANMYDTKRMRKKNNGESESRYKYTLRSNKIKCWKLFGMSRGDTLADRLQKTCYLLFRLLCIERGDRFRSSSGANNLS